MTDTKPHGSLTDEKLWHLQHCPLFSGISRQEMEHLRDVTVMVKLEPEDRILADPEDPNAIWFIKEGLMSLTYGDAEGKDATVLLLGPETCSAPWRGPRISTTETWRLSNRPSCAA